MMPGWSRRLGKITRALLPYRVDRRAGGRVAVGNRGEALAVKHLKANWYRVLGQNVTLRFGEIDIVAETAAGLLVIVEVKATNPHPGHHPNHRPERQVNAAKRRQLQRLAAALMKLRGWQARAVRFDVIAVEFHEGGEPVLRHHVNAFGRRR